MKKSTPSSAARQIAAELNRTDPKGTALLACALAEPTKPRQWYTAKSAGDHQGLVIEEGTGRNVAVTYDKADAPLVASAPTLAELLFEALLYVEEGEQFNKPTCRTLSKRIRAALPPSCFV